MTGANAWGVASRADRIDWVIAHRDFKFKPATIEEFLGPGYLDMDPAQNPLIGQGAGVRAGVKKALIDIFGEQIDPARISRVRRAVMSGGIGIGKCSSLDAMTNLSDGTYRRAADVRPGDMTPGGMVVASESNGIKPVYIVRTSWGIDLEVTGNHPIMANGQWVAAQDLRPGDELAMLSGWEASSPLELDADDYRLAGYLLADGSVSTGTPCWTKGDKFLVEDMRGICERKGWTLREVERRENYSSYRIVSGGDAKRLLMRWGMFGKTAHDKRVPEFVFRSTNERIAQFLCAYLESDGHIDKACNSATFYSVNRDLLRDVQKLLLRLGVPSVLTLKNGRYNGARHISWRLTILAAGKDVISAWPFRNTDKNKLMAFAWVDPDTVPRGLCGCGCGESTAIPAKSRARNGIVKGVPMRFRRGHANRHRASVVNPANTVTSVEYKGDEETWAIQVEPTNRLYIDDCLTHNTTFASIALTYMAHWVLCLKDPQQYFGLLPGSRIAFMLMSTKGSQTNEVLFTDIKARVANSEWFKKNVPPATGENVRRTNQIRFPHDIWIIPGNSQETTFEGFNCLAAVIDEGDSHKVSDVKDYAEAGWDTLDNRISSRFTDLVSGDHKGLLIAIGQMKMSDGFMARKKRELERDIAASLSKGEPPKAAVVTMTIWESFGWEKYRNPKTGKIPVFYYDRLRRQIIPPGPGALVKHMPHVLRIPQAYAKQFELDPVKALRDLAGIPPEVEDPFIAMTDRVDEAMDKYEEHHPDLLVPVSSNPVSPQFHERLLPAAPMRRVIHVDIAWAAHGDALGMAMGYVKEVVEVDGEYKPYIVFDFLLRMKAAGGQQIMLADFRQRIYEIRDRGFNIGVVTFDGFSSQDSQQILRQKRINSGLLSVDRSKGPYEDLREAINERRIEFPRYMTYLNRGDTEKVCIARKELLELTDTGRKVDHPARHGSKDVADAMAGVVTTLMGNMTYRRGARLAARQAREQEADFSQYAAPPTRRLTPFELEAPSREDGAGTSLDSLVAGRPGPRGLPGIEADPFSGLLNPRML